jgi:hypothetical protein
MVAATSKRRSVAGERVGGAVTECIIGRVNDIVNIEEVVFSRCHGNDLASEAPRLEWATLP